MFTTRLTKVAIAGVAASVVAAGTAVALAAGLGRGPQQAAGRVDRTVAKTVSAIPTVDGVIVTEAGILIPGATESSATAGATTSGAQSPSGGVAGTSAGGGNASGGATVGIVGPSGGSGAGGSGTVGGGTGTVGGGTGTVGGGAGAGGAGSGTGTGAGTVPGSDEGDGGPTVTKPSIPTDVSLFREGSYTVNVPGTPAVAKRLCLSGEVNRCKTVSVPALKAVTMTVSYSANASASAPTFTVFPCAGGLGVSVAGITPGTNVSVHTEGVDVAGTLGTDEVTQSASLCNA